MIRSLKLGAFALLVTFGLVAPTYLSAQSNDVIDVILEAEQISYSHAAYLLLIASGDLDQDAAISAAHDAAENSGFAQDYPPDQGLTLGEFSYIAMETFDVPGGMMYSIFPSPRYATRELEFRRVIQGNAYPNMPLSGQRAMRILGRLLTLQEDGRIR